MKFLNNLKIAKKLTLSFALLVIVTAAMAVVAFSSISEIETADEHGQAANELQAAYLNFQKSFLEQRQALLYFLLTGDRTGLAKFEELNGTTDALHNKLSELSAGDEVFTKLVTDFTEFYQQWKDKYANVQVDLMRNYLTVNQARAIEVSGEPEAVIAEMGTIIQELGVGIGEVLALSNAQKADAISKFTISIITALVAMVAASFVCGILLTRGIATPIGRMTGRMSDLADGKLDIEIDGAERQDEIGEMARAVLVFKENAIAQIRLEEEAKRTAEEQERREQAEREREAKREADERAREQEENAAKQERAEKISNLIQAFEGRVQEVMETVNLATNELRVTATSMTDTANSSQQLSEAVAMASEEASTNVQTVAAAAEELTSSINEISRQVQQANNVSERAVSEAASSTQSVSRLAETAKKISDVINMINDIAGQTNLLALNATIEAARAGEAGKGFAVVASEVKSLATQTARATDEISSQINDMQTATDEAVSAIGNIDGVINTIRESTVSISSAIEEQSAATNEISRNVQEASSGTTQVSSKIGEVSVKTGETGAAATQVLSASTRLEELSGNLRRDIEAFLTEVRAA
ncbi:MAG: hypothetical protein CMN56_10265 [Sneathiella sp.]|uniref:methyl-accepting chemotaxis protein n=1 Tax=Sneathiella sp. TaxID=1964365 RepID=UPI000C3A4C6F|nr:methyl-accepting chemotaxis protein [Sneathiella sp.]MAZ03512.1 hypothetical protein [Sneathiella sp.]